MTQPTPGQHGPGTAYPGSRPAFASMPPQNDNGLQRTGPPAPAADAGPQARCSSKAHAVACRCHRIVGPADLGRLVLSAPAVLQIMHHLPAGILSRATIFLSQAQQMRPPLKRQAVQQPQQEPPNEAPRPTPGAQQVAAPRPVGQLHRQVCSASLTVPRPASLSGGQRSGLVDRAEAALHAARGRCVGRGSSRA